MYYMRRIGFIFNGLWWYDVLESVTIMTSQCGSDGRGPMGQQDICLPRRRDYGTVQSGEDFAD